MNNRHAQENQITKLPSSIGELISAQFMYVFDYRKKYYKLYNIVLINKLLLFSFILYV